jgi:sec-independent protein translocase protein TatA
MFTGLENPTHILMLLVLAVLFFGVKRLPEIGRSLGTGMREFRESITGASHAGLPRRGDADRSAEPRRAGEPEH